MIIQSRQIQTNFLLTFVTFFAIFIDRKRHNRSMKAIEISFEMSSAILLIWFWFCFAKQKDVMKSLIIFSSI